MSSRRAIASSRSSRSSSRSRSKTPHRSQSSSKRKVRVSQAYVKFTDIEVPQGPVNYAPVPWREAMNEIEQKGWELKTTDYNMALKPSTRVYNYSVNWKHVRETHIDANINQRKYKDKGIFVIPSGQNKQTFVDRLIRKTLHEPQWRIAHPSKKGVVIYIRDFYNRLGYEADKFRTDATSIRQKGLVESVKMLSRVAVFADACLDSQGNPAYYISSAFPCSNEAYRARMAGRIPGSF